MVFSKCQTFRKHHQNVSTKVCVTWVQSMPCVHLVSSALLLGNFDFGQVDEVLINEQKKSAISFFTVSANKIFLIGITLKKRYDI